MEFVDHKLRNRRNKRTDKFAHLLGHEGSGTVVDVANGVCSVKEGDNVVLHWMKGME